MRKIVRTGLIAGLSLLLAASYIYSQNEKHAYVGSKQCMPCHMAPAKGAQFKQWQGTQHAKAYETLGTEEAKKVAAEEGIDNPQEAEECVRCHVTAYDVSDERKTMKYSKEDGIGCETCHGPGGDYWKMNVMKGIAAGKMDAKEYGLVANPDAETCKECHNEESPTFKGFNYDEFYEKIAHPNPQKQ